MSRLLLGLKDYNDDLASKTFSCLSIMVKLLGSEVVIGPSFTNNTQKFKYFSNNLPKVSFALASSSYYTLNLLFYSL